MGQENTNLILQRVEQGWFRPDGTWINSAPFTEPKASGPSDDGPVFGPPTEEEVFLKAYEARSDAAIRALKKATLVALCVNKLKGSVQNYKTFTKPVLTDLILQLVSCITIFLDLRLTLYSEKSRESNRNQRIHQMMNQTMAATINHPKERRCLEKKRSKPFEMTWSAYVFQLG
jgi:hypothetical protein